MQALEGVRVLDWTIWQQGPLGTALLGDLGAEVIKLEACETGDPGRGLGWLSGMSLAGRPNFYIEANNRNKKSITLDVKKPEGREIVFDLVRRSDVFVQNFRVGVAERLGLDALAEGVETPGEHAFVQQIGFSHAQGYVIARPLPLDATDAFLAAQHQQAAQLPLIPRRAG